eukprot:m.295414 g.295414  ORF g.295414 m.295414 type:complete len:202 (+) comp13193_c0_seq1:25-630(+)
MTTSAAYIDIAACLANIDELLDCRTAAVQPRRESIAADKALQSASACVPRHLCCGPSHATNARDRSLKGLPVAKGRFHAAALPPEVLLAVFDFLEDPRHLVAALGVCMHWRRIIEGADQRLWKKLCCAEGWQPQAAPDGTLSYRRAAIANVPVRARWLDPRCGPNMACITFVPLSASSWGESLAAHEAHDNQHPEHPAIAA